jgi:3-oxoacyl-[acyl-carrier protein] reductase
MRNIVVTGGTRGIGLAIALRLVRDGFRVIAVARSEPEAFAQQRHAVARSGCGALAFREADLSDLAELPRLVSTICAEYGPLYGLVNNAGLGTSGVLATMRDSSMEALLRLNVASPIALTKYAVRRMMAAGGGGRIVTISSIVASTGFSGLSVYAATKSALIGFSRSLARELGPLEITVNCVAPGFVSTELTKDLTEADRGRIARRSALRRLAEAEDVAEAVRYLVSDQARNVTGTTMTIDAGGTA